MLKGCRKQMIVLRGTGSEIFDEAYFVLKKGEEKKDISCKNSHERAAMLLEANRILEENRLSERSRSGAYYALRYLLCFLAGIMLGGGSVLLSVILS